MSGDDERARALTIACPAPREYGCGAAPGQRCRYPAGVVGMVERDEPHPERIALAPAIDRVCALVAALPEVGQPFTAQQRAAILAAVGHDLPPLASAALRRILVHGGQRLGVDPTASHPHRSVRDHLAAARRHLDRALKTTNGDAIDPDSGELHATCALGRAALAVDGLEARRG